MHKSLKRESKKEKKQQLSNTLITFDFFPRPFSVLVIEAFMASI